MNTKQEGPLGFGVIVDRRNSPFADQVGKVSVLLDLDVVVPEVIGIRTGRSGLVRIVIERLP